MTSVPSEEQVPDDGEFERSLVRAIHEASPDGILVVDAHGLIVSNNQRLFEVIGITPDDIPGAESGFLGGLPVQLLMSIGLGLVKNPVEVRSRIKTLLENPTLEDRCEIEFTDNRTLERYSRALWGENRQYLGRVWFFHDITAHKQAEASLRDLSRTDPLTGVANRRHFLVRASEEFSRAKRFGHGLCVIMFDVDRFKRINDCWGHSVGDKVLQNICRGIQAVLRQVDFLARIGGEEFVVLAPDTDLDGALRLGERLRRHATDWSGADPVIHYTLSAGVAALAPGDGSVDAVLRRADNALYQAKHNGRNCIVPATGHSSAIRTTVQISLNSSVARDRY